MEVCKKPNVKKHPKTRGKQNAHGGLSAYHKPRLIQGVDFPMDQVQKGLVVSVGIDSVDGGLHSGYFLGLGNRSEGNVDPKLIS